VADLRVDGYIGEMSRDLRAIRDEFETAGQAADDHARVWGQRDVGRAMQEFADNWRVHRDEILERLTTLGERVDQVDATWTDAEAQLADSIQIEDRGRDA
jgi:hypothetical protein